MRNSFKKRNIFLVQYILMAVKSNYLPEFVSNQFVSIQNLDSTKLKNSKTTLNIEDVGKFQCPTFNDLDTIPQNCKTIEPKYEAAYRSSLYAIYPPRNPGPSEQTHGIKDVIMAAIELRKSLMLSNFTTHGHDFQSSLKIVPFGARVDVEQLCKLITLTTPAEVNKTLTAIVTISNRGEPMAERLLTWEQTTITAYIKDYSKMRVLADFSKIQNYTMPARMFSNFPEDDNKNLKKFFQDSGMAYHEPEIIGMAHPYNWIYGEYYQLIDAGGAYRGRRLGSVEAPNHAPNWTKHDSVQKLRTEKELVKQVYRHTGHPKFVRQLAKTFVKNVLGTTRGKYVTVHWRFNEGDFLSSDFRNHNTTVLNKGVHARGLNMEISNHLQQTLKNPVYFLDLLLPHIEKNFENYTGNSNDFKTIFITSPADVAKEFKNIGSRIYKGYKIFTTNDSEEFMRKYSENCELLKVLFGDVVSTFEKEVIVQSLSFYRTRPSNWSFNVQGHRFARYTSEELKYDRVIYDVFSGRQKRSF